MGLFKEAEVISPVPQPPSPSPPPPPPMDLASKGGPKKDLLAQIREGAVKKKVSLNHQDYNHVSTVPSIEKVGGWQELYKNKWERVKKHLLKKGCLKERLKKSN
ncbi:MAG: hypothetical protein AB8B68_03500 [Rickettsiaceae bacterium]